MNDDICKIPKYKLLKPFIIRIAIISFKNKFVNVFIMGLDRQGINRQCFSRTFTVKLHLNKIQKGINLYDK